MYCEKKGGECGYLGFVSELKENLTVERLAASEGHEFTIGSMEEIAEKALGIGRKLECTDDFCSIVAYAITNTFELEARQNETGE